MLAPGLLLDDLHVVDVGVGGAAATPGDEAIDSAGFTLEAGLHPAVGKIAGPARDPLSFGHTPAGVAEADALDPSGDDHTPTHRVHDWQEAHRKLDLPPRRSRVISPPQRVQGSPSRAYTRCRDW